MKNAILSCTAGICCLSLVVLPQQVDAQNPGVPPVQQQQATSVSPAMLEKVAEAYVQIAQIQKQHQAQLQNADDPAAARNVQVKADAKMREVISKVGISEQQYNQTIAAVQQDEALRQKFFETVNSQQ